MEIGRVTDYMKGPGAAVVELTAPVRTGDRIRFKGRETDFLQEISSMQIEHKDVGEAAAGDAVGILTVQPVSKNDRMLKE
jgi:hypothetical protein